MVLKDEFKNKQEPEKKNSFTVIKQNGVKVVQLNPADKLPPLLSSNTPCLLPPLDAFNTGYIKSRPNDPL